MDCKTKCGVLVPALIALCIAFTADADAPRPAAPRGWDKATLGMSVAELRQVYAKAEELPPLPSEQQPGRTRRLVLWKLPEKELKQTVDVEFRFWDDQLWMILIYGGQVSPTEFQTFLERRFGEPPIAGDRPSWLWPTTKVVANLKERWLAIFDRRLARDVQAAAFPGPAPTPAK